MRRETGMAQTGHTGQGTRTTLDVVLATVGAALVALGVAAAAGGAVALGVALVALGGVLFWGLRLHQDELRVARAAAEGVGGRTGAEAGGDAAGASSPAEGAGQQGTSDEASGQAEDSTASGPSDEPARPRADADTSLPTGEIGRAELDGLITRSADVVATLKDLASHHPEGTLVASLRRSGILDWEGAPAIHGSILARNDRVWLGADPEQIEAEASFDALVAGEAAINTYRDALALGGDAPLGGRMRGVLANTRRLSVPAGLRSDDDALPDGEWVSRVRLAELAEDLPVPVRFAFDMQVDVGHGAFSLSLEVPRPAAFSFLYDEPARRSAAALGYALDLAVLCTRCAFRANGSIRHVDVRCHAHGEDAPRMQLQLSRGEFDALAPRLPGVGRGDALFDPTATQPSVAPEDDSPTLRLLDGALVLHPGEDGWPLPFEPGRAYDEGGLTDAARWQAAELSHGPAPGPVARALRTPALDGIGIDEDAGRVAAWEDFRASLDGTVSGAVTRLAPLRGADDITVAAAAQRLSGALVDGTADVTDEDGMREAFLGGDELTRACLKAQADIAEQKPETLPDTLATLERALAPTQETGIYLDDAETDYRYFNSVDERLVYNWALAREGRRVRLVPDAYFAALALAAQLAEALDNHDAALAHAMELARIAPATFDATLVQVHVLDAGSATFDAIEALRKAIPLQAQPHKLAVLFYRLAYMEWRAGASQLAVACYVRSFELSPLMVAQAGTELETLLASDDALRRLDPHAAREALAGAGIPLGTPELWLRRIRRAAVACVDANAFSPAWKLLGCYLEGSPTDVLADVYRSVRPSG